MKKTPHNQSNLSVGIVVSCNQNDVGKDATRKTMDNINALKHLNKNSTDYT